MKRLLLTLGAALAFGASCARAAETVWTGAAGNGLWSDGENWSAGVPGTADTAVFDGTAVQANATVDEDFAGTVGNLTLAADYAGTITLARESLKIVGIYTQYAGTFTAGEHDIEIGSLIWGTCASQVGTAQFLHYGGTFNAPANGHMLSIWSSGSVLTFLNAGVWNHNDGTVRIGEAGWVANGYLYSTNRAYCNLTIAVSGSMNFAAIDSVEGAFVHQGGALKKAAGAADSRLDLYGDLEIASLVKSNGKLLEARGGDLPLMLVGDTSTQIKGSVASSSLGYGGGTGNCAGWHFPRTVGCVTVNKTGGAKVTATCPEGGSVNFGNADWTSGFATFRIESGELDLSGVPEVSFDNVNLSASDPALVTFPPQTSTALGRMKITGSGFAFNSLKFDTYNDNQLDPNSTNTVKGDLFLAYAYLREMGQASTPAVLNVQGDFICAYDSPLRGQQRSDNVLVRLCGQEDSEIVATNVSAFPVIIAKDPSAKVSINHPTVALGGVTIESGILDLGTNIYAIGQYTLGAVLQTGGRILTKAGGGFGFISDSYPDTQGVNLDPNASISLIDPIADFRMHIGCNAWTRSSPTYEDCEVRSRIVVTNKYWIGAGRLSKKDANSLLEVQGDFEIDDCYDVRGGTCPILFSGDRDQHYRCGEAGTNAYATVTVAKTGGRLILDTDMDLTKHRMTSQTVDPQPPLQDVFLTSGTLDLNGHRLILPSGKLTVADGFTLALPPLDYADGAVASAGTVSLPPEGVANVRIDLMRGAAEAANPVRLCAYGKLEGFTDASCAVVPTDWVSRGKVTNDADASLLTVGWRRRGGFGVLVK